MPIYNPATCTVVMHKCSGHRRTQELLKHADVMPTRSMPCAGRDGKFAVVDKIFPLNISGDEEGCARWTAVLSHRPPK
jgi:hypothetical protein